MDLALIASAFVLGLAGAPHCTAMCAAPCAAAVGRGGAPANWAFHGARIAGYALAGAVAAASVNALALWAQLTPVVRPLWTVLHAAAFALGLWLLWQGRQPAFLAQFGRVPQAQTAAVGGGWQRMQGPLRAASAGGLWVAWPCGLLQSALVVAALANSPLGGAAAMAAFALASSAGLVFAPWVWAKLGRAGGERAERLAVRAAGAMLAGMSGWALTHGLWQQVAAFCATL
jgi:hypothetical protein